MGEGWKHEYRIKLTPYGIEYYDTHWSAYRSRYPDVEAKEPQSVDFTQVQNSEIGLIEIAQLVKAKRGNQNLRDLAKDLTEQFGIEVSPRQLGRVEHGKIERLEVLETLEKWLCTNLDSAKAMCRKSEGKTTEFTSGLAGLIDNSASESDSDDAASIQALKKIE
jgi:hypothetical protein